PKSVTAMEWMFGCGIQIWERTTAIRIHFKWKSMNAVRYSKPYRDWMPYLFQAVIPGIWSRTICSSGLPRELKCCMIPIPRLKYGFPPRFLDLPKLGSMPFTDMSTKNTLGLGESYLVHG